MKPILQRVLRREYCAKYSIGLHCFNKVRDIYIHRICAVVILNGVKNFNQYDSIMFNRQRILL